MTRILVTGAAGQIGTELVPALRAVYGEDKVMATDLRPVPEEHPIRRGAPFRTLDCTSGQEVAAAASGHGAQVVYHLAALLSAVGERNPQEAYRVNLGGLMAVLEVARERGMAVFTPSSIAAFGPSTPADPAPQETIQRPTTMYGVTKVAGELLCDYYHHRFQVDSRGVRYPGLVSHTAPPGGGTTDWAVEIFHHALEHGSYTTFLRDDTRLDMMYMDDAIRSAMELMEADPHRLRHRNAYNVTAMQITPGELAAEIRRSLPDFRLSVAMDPIRQAIADSWPRRIDDSAARKDWGWKPRYDASGMTLEMLHHLRARRTSPP